MEKSFIQKTLPVGPLRCNCQILVCAKTMETVLIDPGDEPEKILKSISEIEMEVGATLNIKALFHTHAHFDHIAGTRKVKEYYSSAPQIFLHKADEILYQNLKQQGLMFGGRAYEDTLPVDQFLEDEQELKFGDLKFSVIHTPGHSPGGVCFRMHEDSAHAIPETVFTGDTLFKESIGRSDIWGGDESALHDSIRSRLFSLDGDTLAWPGHGERTLIGHEKYNNPFVR